MKDILAKLAALSGAPTTDKKVLTDTSGKKQLTNSVTTKKPLTNAAGPSMKRLMEAVDAIGEASQWEEQTLGLDEPKEGPIGEAAPPSLGTVYPDTKQGVLQYMQYGYDKSFLKTLDLPTCIIHADPQVEGVWAVDSMASGFRCVIYLAGYRTPMGKRREHNDNEEGSFTLPYMKKLIEHGSLDPARMEHWVQCDSIDEATQKNLMKYYNYWNDLDESMDEALLSGPTQRSPEPDWDEDSYGDPDSDNYCDNCGENFPMDYDSCPNCTDSVEEALGADIMDPDWTPDDVGFGDKQEEDSIDSLPPEELFNFFKKIGAATGRSVKQVAMDRGHGDDRYWRKIMWVGEDTEQVNELSRKTLGNYVKKNTTDQQLRGMKSTIAAFNHMADTGEEVTSDNLADVVGPDEVRRDKNRVKGFNRAVDKLSQEGIGEEQVNELSDETLNSYLRKSKDRIRQFQNLGMAQKSNRASSKYYDKRDLVSHARTGARERLKGFYHPKQTRYGAKSNPQQDGLGEAGGYGDNDNMWAKITPAPRRSNSEEAVAGAITFRITRQRLDLLKKYGPEAVMNAIDNVAEFVGDVDEIGSSDVSAWVNDVERQLGGRADNLDEAGGQMWEVSWWVEEKSYDDRPGREYSESELVAAPTAQAAFQIIKDRPKQVGKMRYDFKVLPAKAGKSDIDEANYDTFKDAPMDKDNEYHIYVKGSSYGSKFEHHPKDVYHSLVDAMRIAGNIRKGSSQQTKIHKVPRTKLAGPKGKLPAEITQEGKNTMRKNKINEDVDVGNAGPELAKILRHFGKELKDFRENGDLDDDLYSALYDYYFDDMPYGTKKARTGDPYEWISERLDSDLNYKFGQVADEYTAKQKAQREIDGEKEYGNFDQVASMPAPGAEGDDKYGYPGYFGQNDLNKPKTEGFGGDIMPLEGVEADSFAPEPLPGEEVITELRVEDESRITDMLSNVGLDHGLDFWFEGDEIVVIGSREARVVTSTVGGHIQSIDGEEFRIGMKPRAAKAAPSDLNDLAAVPEVFEGKFKDQDTANKEKRDKAAAEARKKKADEKKKLKEEVTADDIEMLNMKYKAGMITYDQFRSELDGLEQTDYSMRQGEMGNPDMRDYMRSSDDDDHDYGNSLDGEEYGDEEFEESALDPDNLDMTDLDYSDVDKQDGLDFRGQADLNFQGSRPKYDVEEGEFANSAEDPQRPSVHTSTTDMINQGNDLNRPKKSYSHRPYRGDNPMAESNQLLKQYNMMKAAITLK